MIERKKNLPNDKTESSLWKMDQDEYDWECLNGCPPGFDCNEDQIFACPTGASDTS